MKTRSKTWRINIDRLVAELGASRLRQRAIEQEFRARCIPSEAVAPVVRRNRRKRKALA